MMTKIFQPKNVLLAVMILTATLWMLPVGNRTWWVFIVGSYVVGFLYFALRGASLSEISERFFAKNVWLHPAMYIEALIGLVAYIISFYVIIYLPTEHNPVLTAIANGVFHLFNVTPTNDTPPYYVAVLFTVATALMYDLGYYVAHFILHKNRFLWEIHKVHHSAQVMTPFTSVRMHPIELVMAHIFRIGFVGFTAAFFLYLYPNAPMMITVGGTNIILFLFLLLGGALAHSHAWISFGPLEKIFISPAMHQVHHSTQPKHFNKNFALLFSFWDQIFGTVYFTSEDEHISYGLGEREDMKYLTFKDVMITPITRGIKASRRKKKKAASPEIEPVIEGSAVSETNPG